MPASIEAPELHSRPTIGKIMKSIGSTLLFFGIGTIVLNLIGFEFAILAWIDMWGETVGWAIRAAMIVGGGVLYFLGSRAAGDNTEPAMQSPRQEPTMGDAANSPSEAPASEPAPDPFRPTQQQ